MIDQGQPQTAILHRIGAKDAALGFPWVIYNQVAPICGACGQYQMKGVPLIQGRTFLR
jgi:hypothetical protein